MGNENLPPTILTDAAKDDAAAIIAGRLLRDAENVGGDISEPKTWETVARMRCLRCIEFDGVGEGRGEYAPSTAFRPTGVIAINIAYPPHEQARTWTHELAHDELHQWCPPQLPEDKDICRYEDDVSDARHDIARRVENLIFGGEE